MLVLSSQSRLLGSNPIVWLCDQEPVKSFQKGPPPEKAKLKRWWTYLSQFRLTVHHIPGIKNELSDYISRNNFEALIGESSEALARETFQRMDVQLDLSMRTARILEGWSLTDDQSEYKEILQTLSTGLEPRVIDGHQWYKNNQYLFYEDRIVVPEARLDGCLQWSHLSSGHTGANRSVDFFRECFYSSLTLTELRSRMQTIVDACGCHASKQRFEVSGLILRVLDAFRPRGATWSGQVISSPPGPSGGPSKTHLLPGGRVPRVHRARSPVLPRLPCFATPRSVHQFAAVAAGAYPPRRPPNA